MECHFQQYFNFIVAVNFIVGGNRSTVFVLVYILCLKHIVLYFCFVCLNLVYPMLPVSLDCSFLIAPSVTQYNVITVQFNKVYYVKK